MIVIVGGALRGANFPRQLEPHGELEVVIGGKTTRADKLVLCTGLAAGMGYPQISGAFETVAMGPAAMLAKNQKSA